ncbi:MAG: DUF2189 domain-containing protein [Rhizobiaceae bacterium]
MAKKAAAPKPAEQEPRKSDLPQVRPAQFEDLRTILSLGWRDFRQAPQFGLFFGAVYAIGGLILFACVIWFNLAWLAYPLVIGFALIGPFIATGLYETSRKLENGDPLTWRDILATVWEQHRRELGWMAFVTLFIFWVWMYQVRTLVAVFFGSQGFASFDGFLDVVFTTTNGLTFLLVGHIVGAIISLVLFTLTVVSCPLLLEREVDFVTALITSIRAVAASPVVMLSWGVFVVLAVILSALPAFLGLLVVLPVLGHATWHLYKRVVVEES